MFTISGRLERPDSPGTPQRGTLVFTPSPGTFVAEGSVNIGQVRSTLTDTGEFMVALKWVAGMAWHVRLETPDRSAMKPFWFEGPVADGQTVPFATLVPIQVPAALDPMLYTKGEGVPLGGTVGQALVKTGPDDFQTAWVTVDGVGVSITDHDQLNGLADDDHQQYALADGSRGAFATQSQGHLADTALQPDELSTVAFTGAYADLGGRPTIPDSPDDIGAAPVVHSHTAAQVTDLSAVVDARIQNVVGAAPAALDTLGEIAARIEDDSDVVAALTAQVADKAPAVHNHDDRYYTDAEMDLLLGAKAASVHTHSTNQITGLDAQLAGGFSVVSASGSGAQALSLAPAHKFAMTGNTTFTFPAPSTTGHSFALNLSGAFAPSFPASVRWADGAAPTYATQSVYVFTTFDGGTTWLGAQSGKAFA